MRNSERRKHTLKFWASFFILAVHSAIWAYFWLTYYAPIIPRLFEWKGHTLVVAVYAVLAVIFLSFYGGFRIGYYRPSDVALSGVLGLIFANGITYLQTCLVGAKLMHPGPMLGMTLIQSVLTSIWALAVGKLYARVVPPHQMLLVYGGDDQAQRLVYKMITRAEKYQIEESISMESGIDKICKKMLCFEAVILCDVPAKERNTLLKYCFEKGIRTYTTPKISDILIRGAVYINLFDTPLLLNRNQGLTLEQRFFKRTLDLVLAGLGAIVFSPVALVIAIAIKLHDGGPILYSQDRLTLGGKIFRVYKFRSMCQDAEQDGAQLSCGDEDHRITPVGKVIRKYRLDELPQLYNILSGNMSIVGPRPERPEIAAEYQKSMPEFSYRLKVKAGLTGFAQVVGRYNTTPYDKLKLDLMYISSYSLAEDFKQIMTTIKILFMKEKTEGIKKGNKTAE